MSDFFKKILNPFGLELGSILNPFGLLWQTPEEMPLQNINQQNKKRKLVDEWQKIDATLTEPVLNYSMPLEPKFKKQKLEHSIATHSAFDFTNDLSDEDELEQDILQKPKTLPSRLPEPKNITQLNRALQQLEKYHHQKLIDLDLGDCSLESILLPLLGNRLYTEQDAWLSNFFIVNFIKEKIVSLGKKDIFMYDLSPDNTKLNSNMTRVTAKNKDKGINKIIWPICHKQHFYLITINYDPIKNTVYIYALDGFNSKKQQQQYLNKANDLAELFYPQADFYMKIPQKIVTQDNAMDCAVVACYYVTHFIKQTASEFHDWVNTFPNPKTIEGMQTQLYTPYRKKIAEVFFAIGNRQLPEPEAQSQERRMMIDIEF